MYPINYVEKNKNIKLTLENFSEVDGVILAMFSLIDLKNCVSFNEKRVSFKKAMEKQIKLHGKGKMGLLLPRRLTKLLFTASNSKRYKNLMIHDCFSLIDEKLQTQTNVLQMDINDTDSVLVFGSTDDTIVGWQEDCSFIYNRIPPCLNYSLDYVNNRVDPKRRYILTGHSKGGMESIYCGFKTKKLLNSIVHIYDFDGPGFRKDIAYHLNNSPLIDKVSFICPSHCVVGKILYPAVKPIVIKSNRLGVMSHDPSVWFCDENGQFIRVPGFKKYSGSIATRINESFGDMDEEKAELFLQDVFAVAYASGKHKLLELKDFQLNSSKEFLNLPVESQKRMLAFFSYLILGKVTFKKSKTKYVYKKDL